jgi:hypothetical protein
MNANVSQIHWCASRSFAAVCFLAALLFGCVAFGRVAFCC